MVGGRIPAKLLMRSDPARPPPSPPCHRLCTPTALPTQSLTTVAPSWSLTTAWRPRRLRPLWHMRRSPSDLTRLLLLFPNTVRVPKVHLRTIRDAAHCSGFEVRRYLRRLPACDAFDCGFARTTTRSSRTRRSLVGGVIPAELLKPSTPTRPLPTTQRFSYHRVSPTGHQEPQLGVHGGHSLFFSCRPTTASPSEWAWCWVSIRAWRWELRWSVTLVVVGDPVEEDEGASCVGSASHPFEWGCEWWSVLLGVTVGTHPSGRAHAVRSGHRGRTNGTCSGAQHSVGCQ